MSRRQNIVSEISSDFLTCHICLETYERPKTLPCGHFFCRDCLFDYCASNSPQLSPRVRQSLPPGEERKTEERLVHCPTCRLEAGIISSDWNVGRFVDRLPDNFYVNSLKDLVANHARNRSTRSRSDRGEGLEARNVDERKLQRSRSVSAFDKTVEVNSLVSSCSSACCSGVFCIQHPREIIQLYCPSHSAVLCALCRQEVHSKCTKCLTLQEAELPFIQPKVQELIIALGRRKATLTETAARQTLRRQQVEMDGFELQKRLVDMRTKLETKISQCFLSAQEDIKKNVSEIVLKTSETLESVQSKESIIGEMIQNLESLLRKAGVCDLAYALSAADPPEDQDNPESSFQYRIASANLRLKPNAVFKEFLESDDNVFGEISCETIPLKLDRAEATGATALTTLEWPSYREPQESSLHTEQAIAPVNQIYRHRKGSPKTEQCAERNESFHDKSRESKACTLKERTKFHIGENIAEKCCVLRNGDIALLYSDEKAIGLIDNSGVFLDSLRLPTIPFGMTPCKNSRKKVSLAVTGYGPSIYFLSTLSRMKLVHSISTQVQYTDISSIPRRMSLVALAPFEKPPLLDLISLQGQVLKTFQTTAETIPFFLEPRNLATSSDFIFVTDRNKLKILTLENEVIKTISSDGNSEFRYLGAVCTCTFQNMCFFADPKMGKLYSLCNFSGDWSVESVINDTAIVREPCDVAAGVIGLVMLSGGKTVRVLAAERHIGTSHCVIQSVPRLPVGQDRYQTH